MNNGLNVVSLCDGMSGGQITLKELDKKINTYYASEIDKNAINTTQLNFPNTIQLGDVNNINEELLKSLPKIDLIMFGSPCVSLSKASQGNKHGGNDNNKGLKGKSGLFFKCNSILQWLKHNNNKDIKFLVENVDNKKHQNDINYISNELGVNPLLINSSDFSAQDRIRNYWTNIEVNNTYNKSNIVLKDILDKKVEDKYYYNCDFDFYGEDKRMAAKLNLYNKPFMQVEKVCSKYFKSYTLYCCRGGNHQVKVYDKERNQCRKLTPNEYRKLQTIPEWYKFNCADSHIYNMLGDGWTIEVIKYLLKNL